MVIAEQLTEQIIGVVKWQTSRSFNQLQFRSSQNRDQANGVMTGVALRATVSPW